MSLDRVVKWKNDRPANGDVFVVVEDFIGGAAMRIDTYGDNTWSVLLYGKPSSALKRTRLAATAHMSEQHDERWFEVFVMDDSVFVTTRMADEYTNAIAKALAELLCRVFDGKMEPT